ncbi:hypothetical protein IV203_013162 [Nitzschia inconspicua]|uniref:Uncharacterized protein n=1 Tax=Nitzschia inconspicua TaxID=303405 RepID=A0A9K3Q784_9STRA|nr:hypothetical protein IV203_013162 [Nitzschia inconspicua]
MMPERRQETSSSESDAKLEISEGLDADSCFIKQHENETTYPIESSDAIHSAEFQQCQTQSTPCEIETDNVVVTPSDTVQTPALLNEYSVEDREDDLQTFSRVSPWSYEMEIMKEVQEKIRLLVLDLDRQREELALELQRHKGIICQLEEQNDLHQVKIDILTSTMREFIKEDPERWRLQEHPARSSSWFGFPFHSSWNSTSPQSVAPSESTTLSTSIDDPQEGDEIVTHQQEESDDVLGCTGLNSCSTESLDNDELESFEGQQGECLPKHESKVVLTTDCKVFPCEPEDSTIGTERTSDAVDAEVVDEGSTNSSVRTRKWSFWNKN